MDLKNKRIFVAGALRVCDHELEELDKPMAACGASFVHKLGGPQTAIDLVVLGNGASERVLAEVERRAIPTVTEDEYLSSLGLLTTNERMTALRGILGQPPSPEVWQALCAHFDEHWLEFDQELSLSLSYADEHLARWPDELRVLPRAWEPDEDGITPYWGQLARVCAPEDPQSPGCLINLWDYIPFEPPPKPKTRGSLPYKDHTTGQHLALLNKTHLQLKDRDGNLLAQTPFDIPAPTEEREGHNFGFSACGSYVWLMAYGPDGASHIYLLNRHDLSIKDQTPLRQPDMSKYRADLGWDQPLCVSPDGKRVALCTDHEYSVGLCCVFWHEEGKITVVNTDTSDGEAADIVGFSPDGSRFFMVGYYHFLYIWALPGGEELVNRWEWETDDSGRMTALFAWNSAENFYCDEAFLLMPLYDDDDFSWGISVHETSTGQLLGRIEAPHISWRKQHEPINILSDRLCVCPGEGKMRYLPSLALLERHASIAKV